MTDTDTGTIGQGVTVTKTGEHGAFGGELLTINFGPHHPSTHVRNKSSR